LKDGEQIFIENDLAKGNPEKPLTTAEIANKFIVCVAPKYSKAKCQQWLALLANFESATFEDFNLLLCK